MRRVDSLPPKAKAKFISMQQDVSDGRALVQAGTEELRKLMRQNPDASSPEVGTG